MSTRNETSGPQSPIINGNHNIVIFNINEPLTKKQVEEEFLKLEIGDLQDVTDETDTGLREKRESIFSYTKNYWLQLKKQLVNDDFHESWLPDTPADMGGKEKKPQWKITPVYQGVVFPFSYFFIGIDSGRYMIPLPIHTENGASLEITKVQYQLGKVLTNGGMYNTSYDDMLKQCKINVV